MVSANDIVTGSVDSDSKSVSFDDLQCNTDYTFRIKAVTVDGEGPFSEAVAAYMPLSYGRHA